MIQFVIPDDWEIQIKTWQKKHKCELRTKKGEFPGDGSRYVGAVGGADTYIFTPTSIGDMVTVRCACGKEIHFSDI